MAEVFQCSKRTTNQAVRLHNFNEDPHGQTFDSNHNLQLPFCRFNKKERKVLRA